MSVLARWGDWKSASPMCSPWNTLRLPCRGCSRPRPLRRDGPVPLRAARFAARTTLRYHRRVVGFQFRHFAAIAVAALVLSGCQSWPHRYHARQVAQHGSAEAAAEAAAKSVAKALVKQAGVLRLWAEAEINARALEIAFAARVDQKAARDEVKEARRLAEWRYQNAGIAIERAVRISDIVHSLSGYGRLPTPLARAKHCTPWGSRRRSIFKLAPWRKRGLSQWSAAVEVCAAAIEAKARDYLAASAAARGRT